MKTMFLSYQTAGYLSEIFNSEESNSSILGSCLYNYHLLASFLSIADRCSFVLPHRPRAIAGTGGKPLRASDFLGVGG